MLTYNITKLNVPPGLTTPMVVELYYKQYYATSWILINGSVTLALDGTVSPVQSFAIDPTLKYEILAINKQCGFAYRQPIIINAYCPPGYNLSLDQSNCYIEEIVSATSPNTPENTVVRHAIQYSTCGSYIYSSFNVNGTGTSSRISLSNPFWVNGAGSCVDNNTTDGPLNRAGVWATSVLSDQDIGFSRCLDIDVARVVYIGMACDNRGIIRVDGVDIISQNQSALEAQYSVGGACFKVWHIYPVALQAGKRIVEMIGHNDGGVAGLGCEIYDNTSAEIEAATSYADLNLLFSSKDFVGLPVQLGTNGIGYECAPGYALSLCEDPVVCKRIISVPVLY